MTPTRPLSARACCSLWALFALPACFDLPTATGPRDMVATATSDLAEGDMAPAGGLSVAQCKATIASKTQQLMGQGIDPATWSIDDAAEMAELTTATPQTPATFKQYDGHYRKLTNHPGCDATNLYYDKANTKGSTPYIDGNNDGKWTGAPQFGGPNAATGFLDGDKASIPSYTCAAKVYAQKNEDTTRPIVILVQGNATRPHTWEKFLLPPGVMITDLENVQVSPDTTARDQLAEKLIAARYQVIAVDLRTDLVGVIDPATNNTTENAAGNVDHGWSVPILQSLIKAVMKNNPTRKVSLIAHSLGPTVARDALRRLYVEWLKTPASGINPFVQLRHVILGSGANHGVSSYDPSGGALCATNPTMRGTIVCEMGSRENYTPTYFHKPLNGPSDLFSTPCADGDYAFGKTGQCSGNVVRYYTITMSDITPGQNYQDFFVSQAASKLDMPGCVVNKVNTRTDYDTSGYFSKGFIANHFGSVRSANGASEIMNYLQE